MKERLIGAAVLVALAVWLIPWVLNGPGPVVDAPSESLELPAAERTSAVRTQTIRLDENRDSPTPVPRNETETTPAPAPREETAAAPAPEPAPQRSAGATETNRPEPTPETTVSERSEPEAAAEGEPAAAATGGEGWMVQIGSFSDEDNAQRLVQRVATFGFNARVSNFDASGGRMYRVRVGPESSRERAVAVASSLSAHGFVAQVVSQD